MKLADYVINRLAQEGIEEMFVVYGAANGDLIDAFTRTNKTKYICTMHEQAAGFAAEGYAKVSGKFGVAIATSGPGGQNFLTPISNCFYDSVACLFITGQVKRQFMRSNPTIRQVGFQETDIVSIVSPVTKYAICIMEPLHVRFEIEKALFYMRTGRPGPVLIDIPIDVQQADINPDELEAFPTQAMTQLPETDKKVYRDLLLDIKAARRPVILVGGGAIKAKEAIQYLSTELNIPCFRTWNAKDIITNDFINFGGDVGTYGGRGRNFAVQNSDLLISIGSRISGRITGGKPETFAREAKKWMIDMDPANLIRDLQQVKIDVNILADANKFVAEFIDFIGEGHPAVRPPRGQFDAWMKNVVEWRDKYDPVNIHQNVKCEGVNPYVFMRKLSDMCSVNDVIVSDCGGNQVIFAHAFETKNGQRCFTNNGNSPMGFSMAAAMGAWFAQQKKTRNVVISKNRPIGMKKLMKEIIGNVICIIGDGGMTMNIQELQTLKTYGINVKVFIINNHIYGITKAFQKVNFEGRSEACGPKGYVPPDFIGIAQAHGISTAHIVNQELDWHSTIQHVLDADKPFICNVECPEWHSYYPKISGWDQAIEDMEPYLSNEEFLENMIIQPSEASLRKRGL